MNHVHELLRLLWVHAGRWLVEQQKLRRRRERARNLETPLRAIRQIFRRLIGKAVKLEYLEELHRLVLYALFLAVVAANSHDGLSEPVFYMEMECDFDIVEHGEFREKADILECSGNAELRYLIRLFADDAAAHEFNLAIRRLIDAREKIERGRLARAVRANEANKLAGIDVKIEIRDGLEAAEHFIHACCFEEWLHYFCPPSSLSFSSFDLPRNFSLLNGA